MKHSVPDGVPNASAVLERLKQIWAGYWPGADPEAIAADIERRLAAAVAGWALTEVAPIGEGNVALVCSVTRAGEPVILKVNPRRHPEEGLMAAGAVALEFWLSTGTAVRLLDERDARMTLLLERVAPGDSLDGSERPWQEKLEILGHLVARLHAAGPPPQSIPALADYAALWRQGLDDPGLDRELDALIADGGEGVLLHGDLHPGNVLRSAEGWTAIDPTAIRGDRHADIWALICPQAPVDGRIRERVGLYAEAAGLDPERALAWARVRAAAECSDWLAPDAIARIR